MQVGTVGIVVVHVAQSGCGSGSGVLRTKFAKTAIKLGTTHVYVAAKTSQM